MFSGVYLFWAGLGLGTFVVQVFLVGMLGRSISFRRDAFTLLAAALIGSILGYGIGYLFKPVTSLFDPLAWVWVIVLQVLAVFEGAAVKYFQDDGTEGEMGLRPLATGMICFLILGVAIFATSWGGFHTEEYASLVDVRVETRDQTLPLVDQSQARLVTDSLAEKRGAELISTSDEDALGSRVYIGEMWGNEIDGKLVWAGALEHTGFGRWSTFRTTPGYVVVSQSNEADAHIVTDRPLRYTESAWFDENVYRHLYQNGYSDYIFSKAVLQIDDDGKPYWLMILLQPKVGFGGHMPTRWLLVDPENGAIQDFEAEADLPEWVDRAYPQDLLADRFDDRLCWSQGWVACVWSGENVIVTTPGIGVTMDPQNRIVYYSGTQFQSSRANGATSGMFIADARTGAITYYRRAGITEDVARNVITQGWANYGYRATDPIPLVLDGEEAYFSVVVDDSGSRKGFGVVSMRNRNVFGVGDSIQSAVSSYNLSLRRADQDAALDRGIASSGEAFYGVVRTITPFVSNGKTVFYVTLREQPSRIFEVGEERIGEFVATVVGDPVRIEASDTADNLVYVVDFDNLRLSFSGMDPETLDEQGKEVYESATMRSGSFGGAAQSPFNSPDFSKPAIRIDGPNGR